MTNTEAIEHLKELKTLKIEFPNTLQEQALELAIKALEERPKGDLISREALKKAIEQGEGVSWDNHGKDDLCVRKKYIDNAPTVEQKYYERIVAQINPVIEARPQGEWIKNEGKDIRDNFYTCSKCGRAVNVLCGETLSDYPFCHCGADMREVRKNDKQG